MKTILLNVGPDEPFWASVIPRDYSAVSCVILVVILKLLFSYSFILIIIVITFS